MDIRTLVLDFGRVVAHFDHRKATEAIAPFAAVSADALHDILHRGPVATDYEKGQLSTDQFFAWVEQQADLELSADEFARLYGDIFWVNEPMAAVLPALARRLPLVLLSNTCDLHARRFLDQFRDHLGHFRQLVLSHEVKARKPEAAIYAHTHALLGCRPEQVLFLDDHEPNVEAARACGWRAEVYPGGDPRPLLARHGLTLDN